MENTTMSLADFHHAVGLLNPGEVILDVRNPDEYACGHIKGSLNIPLPELPSRWQELKDYKRVYIHCKRGARAKSARDLLATAGLTNLVCLDTAGMDHWCEAGYPVEK